MYCGTEIEVKSSAYLQSWEQKQLSDIKFDIVSRAADIHIFCIQTDKLTSDADLLNPERWKFYVVPTRLLPAQKSIALTPLNNLCGKAALAQPVTFTLIRNAVERARE
jgi:hypothetical protein